MEIQRLKSEIIAKIKSHSILNSVTQSLVELVLNSLDAKSTAVAIRVNLITFRLQVVDNGDGITRENLELVGLRYMTNKCKSLDQLEKQVKFYGFRGETLANIIDMSRTVEITSKYTGSSETYCKSLGTSANPAIKLLKNRPSCGTTVTVEDFMYNLPIRKNRIIPELELEDIKKNIENLIIMHPNVSFSIRNDVTGDLLLNNRKTKDIISSFKYIHPKIESEYRLMKVSKGKTSVEALIFKELSENKHLQYIYVNKRSVCAPNIQKFVASLYYKVQKSGTKSESSFITTSRRGMNPVYVINIRCPHSNVDLLLNASKTMVEFKNWNAISHCLEKLIYSFFDANKDSTNDRYLTVAKEAKSECGVSQIIGMYRAFGYKRHNIEKDDAVPEKLQRVNSVLCDDIIEETQFTNKRQKSHPLQGPEESKDLFEFRVDDDEGNQYNIEKELKNPEINILELENDQPEALPTEKSQRDTVKKTASGLKSSHNVKGRQDKHPILVPSQDGYHISNFTPTAQIKTRKFKEPLPVKVSLGNKKYRKTVKPNEHSKYRSVNAPVLENFKKGHEKSLCNVNSFNCLRLNNEILPDDDISLFSTFTNNEDKGKNFIMDMFLKSTQAYSSEEDIRSVNSEETLLEVESNIFMENNVQTSVNGISKTMSVSVNIKSTKKIKKQDSKKKKKSSKCLQTSLEQNKMVSKCVQTSIEHKEIKKATPSKDTYNDSKLGDNYTIVFSDKICSEKVQRIKFVPKHEATVFNFEPNNCISTPNCTCECHTNIIFKFNNSKNKKGDIQSNAFNANVDFPNLNCNNFEAGSVECNSEAHRECYDKFPENHFDKVTVKSTFKKLQQEPSNHFTNYTSRNKKHVHCLKSPLKNDFEAGPVECNSEAHRDCYDKFPENHFHKVTVKSSFKKPQQEPSNHFTNHTSRNKKHVHCLKSPLENIFFTKQTKVFHDLQQENVDARYESPYFLPKDKYGSNIISKRCNPEQIKLIPNHKRDTADQFSFYKFFDPQCQSTQVINICNDKENQVNYNDCLKSLSDFTITNFGEFQPVFKSTQAYNTQLGLFRYYDNPKNNCFSQNHSKNECVITHLKGTDATKNFYIPKVYTVNSHSDIINVSEYTLENGADNCSIIQHGEENFNKEDVSRITNVNRSVDDNSNLVITLSNQQKQNILDKELDAERKINEKKFLDWDSQTIGVGRERLEELETEWIKKVNNLGSNYYINKKTGYTTFYTPKPNFNKFRFDKRLEFLPKGSSPIIKYINTVVDKSLSPNKKEVLQNYILESHQDELLIVKWQNYMKHNDAQSFFEEMYKEKAAQFADAIPHVATRGNNNCLADSIISFDKDLFKNITVIGQLDKKFIVVLDNSKDLLILFDQHAVHERIRLEEILEVYADTKVECDGKFIVFIPQNDLSLLRRHELYLNSLGLTIEFFENGLTVSGIPLCLYRKLNSNNSEGLLHKAIQQLINEIIVLLKATRGVSFKNLPPMIQSILNMDACRGAIKFGDSLKMNESTELLKSLSICKLPFQCAHGRPTLTPLISIKSEMKVVPQRLNFNRLAGVLS